MLSLQKKGLSIQNIHLTWQQLIYCQHCCHPQRKAQQGKDNLCSGPARILQLRAETGAGTVSKERNRFSSWGDISELFTLLPCINDLSSVPSKSQFSLTALEEAGQGGFNEWNKSNLVVKTQMLTATASTAPHSSPGTEREPPAWPVGKQLKCETRL